MDQAPPTHRSTRRRLAAVLAGLAAGLILVVVVVLVPRGPAALDHEVLRGDTLGRIAAEYGVSVEQLRAWNGLEGDLIHVGQVLRIHAAGKESDPGPRRARSRAGATAPTSGSARALPPELPCLPPPDPEALGEGDEPVFLASLGLSQAQVEAAMGAALPGLHSCVAPGSEPSGVLTFELQVACTGRVSSVRVLDRATLPDPLVDCVADSLRYAAFPAHDLPDGFGFHYPVSFRW